MGFLEANFSHVSSENSESKFINERRPRKSSALIQRSRRHDVSRSVLPGFEAKKAVFSSVKSRIFYKIGRLRKGGKGYKISGAGSASEERYFGT